MRASIIILTKNAGRGFEKLLNRIQSQTYKDFDVVVVDSGSTDSTIEISESYGCIIKIIKPEDFHHSRTRNLGAELAEGEYLVYITQDSMPSDNFWLENLLSPFNDDNVAGVYGRQIAYSGAKPMDKFFYSYFYPNEFKVLTKNDIKNEKEFYVRNVFVSDVNSCYRKDVFMEIKFKEDIIMAEDKDFAIRALLKGYKIIYEPKVVVYHSHNYGIISGFKRRFKDGYAFAQITGNGNANLTNLGIKYLKEEFKLLWCHHKIWLPYAVVYELLNAFGFKIGEYRGK